MSSIASRPVVLGGTRGLTLTSAWPVFDQRERDEVMRALDSGAWGNGGPIQEEFERRFAELQGARYGLCVANGTVAIQLALEALDVGFDDEVIVPGLTWQATAAAVLDVNATPVLVDVSPTTYCIDPDLVERAITPRTRGIIAVHLYSSLADLDRLQGIARQHGLFLIEDCAHGHGSEWNGRGVGSHGEIGCFSFQMSKTLTSGEGGFVATNDPGLFELLWSLRHCGRKRDGADEALWHPIQSGNYRMSELQAAVLLAQLDRFGEQLRQREQNAGMLDEALSSIPGLSQMETPPQVTRRNMYEYAFRYNSKEWEGFSGKAFRRALSEELGIGVGTTYAPLNMSPLYQPLTKRRHRLSEEYSRSIDPTRFDLPVAERAYADEAVLFPHQLLLNDGETLLGIPDAVRRLRDHLPELIRWEAGGDGSGWSLERPGGSRIL